MPLRWTPSWTSEGHLRPALAVPATCRRPQQRLYACRAPVPQGPHLRTSRSLVRCGCAMRSVMLWGDNVGTPE
jgi:hypothetical protein